jgi:hypothetical protein
MEAQMDSNKEGMDGWPEEMKAWRKETTAYQATEANPEMTRADLGQVRVAAVVFEESLKKMDTMDLEASPEEINSLAKLLKMRPQRKLSEHWMTDRRTSDQPCYIGFH